MNLDDFKAILCRLHPNVYHTQAYQEKDSYVVWHEYGRRMIDGNKFWRIQIDFYTSREYDAAAFEIIEGLRKNDEIAVKEPNISYEKEIQKYRYIILCEVAC